jgi:hypothetical protein
MPPTCPIIQNPEGNIATLGTVMPVPADAGLYLDDKG